MTYGTPIRDLSRPPIIVRDEAIDGDVFALRVQTFHGACTAITMVHRQQFDRRIGGARFVREGSLVEVAHLAAAMTSKCAVSMLPADGQKSIIICPDGIPTFEERARILRAHLRVLAAEDSGVIVGPDMENPEAVQDMVADDADLLDHVTGLSERHGGLSIDRCGYTSMGLEVALDAARSAVDDPIRSATIQGFGAVGAGIATRLAALGIGVRAVSTWCGTVRASDNGSLDIARLLERRAELESPEGLAAIVRELGDGVSVEDRDALLDIPADLFVPAARTMVLATADELSTCRKENEAVRDVARFAEKTGTRMIVQGANHPLSRAAERHFEMDGGVVLPDFIVNSGGLIGCYFEWAFRDRRRSDGGPADALAAQAQAHLRRSIRDNVRAIAAHGGGCRVASSALEQQGLAKLRFCRGSRAGPHSRARAREWLRSL